MKVKCISQCQSNREVLYEVGKTYDIPEEVFENNKDRFEKVETKATNKKGAE